MNPTNDAAPTLFASVRSSRDRALTLVGGTLLVAFALQTAAFLPQLAAARSAERAQAAEVAPAAAPVLAARRPPARAPASAVSAPCQGDAPRG